MVNLPIYDQVLSLTSVAHNETTTSDEFLTQLHDTRNRIHLVEQVYNSRIESLVSTVELANKMFDHFADIYVDKSTRVSCPEEIAMLKLYLRKVMKNHAVPSSKGMQIMWEDKTLEGITDE